MTKWILVASCAVFSLAAADSVASRIGHHFHNVTEEMFVIWGGDAEFTVDGRTSLLKGPVGVPVRSGHSHAVYNPGDKPIEWMNISVRVSDQPNAANRDADPTATFDLGD